MAGNGGDPAGGSAGSSGLSQLASTGPGVGGNPLAPGPVAPNQTGLGLAQLGSNQQGSAGPRYTNDLAGETQKAHDQAKAQYEQLTKARGMLDHMRREMDQLTDMGDTVSPEEVVAAAGRVVGHGVASREMAMLLADMPTMAGQGLAAWIQAHDAGVRQQEMHVSQMLRVASHRYGVSGIGMLAADHLANAARGMLPKAGGLGPRPTGGEAGVPSPASQLAPGGMPGMPTMPSPEGEEGEEAQQ